MQTFKFPLNKISNKILHGYAGKETFWSMLKEEKVLVLNGWDNSSLKRMLKDISEISKESGLANSQNGKSKRRKPKQENLNIQAVNDTIRIVGYIEHD